MSRTMLLRIAAATALALAAPTTAQAAPKQAGPPVCNQASPHFQGGGLIALDEPVDSPAARFTTDLSPLPGQGRGLANAASRSPALTLCGENAFPSPPGEGGEDGPIINT